MAKPSYIRTRIQRIENVLIATMRSLDTATIGLIAIANHEIQQLDIRQDEPDAESSPARLTPPRADHTLDESSTMMVTRTDIAALDLQPNILSFDIFARDDVCDASVQTCGEWEPLITADCVESQNGIYAQQGHSSPNDLLAKLNETHEESYENMRGECFDERNENGADELALVTSRIQPEVARLRSDYLSSRDDKTPMFMSDGQRQISEKFREMMFFELDSLIRDALTCPRTQLTRKQFDQQGNTFHRSGLWDRMCEKYCNGTKILS